MKIMFLRIAVKALASNTWMNTLAIKFDVGTFNLYVVMNEMKFDINMFSSLLSMFLAIAIHNATIYTEHHF